MSKEIKNKIVPKLRFPEFKNDGEWEGKKIGEIAEVTTGNTPSTKDLNNYGGNRLFVSPADISESRYITKTKTTLSDKGYSQTRHIKENSVLFVCIGSTIGKIAQNKYECSTNQQINSLIPHDGYSSDFFYSALEYKAADIATIAGNQAVPIINKSLFSSVLVGFPSYEEQQKIASCLSSLDELITAQSQKLEALKAHKKGLMQQLFPAEGEKVPKLRFTEFRDSGEWKEKMLKDICQMQAGKFVSASEINENKNDNLFPCYGGNGLRGYTKSYTHSGRYSLIGRQGALCGNITLADGKFHATEHAVVVTPNEGVDISCLFYLLIHLNLNQYATGQAQPGLSVENLEKVEIKISVSEKEQQKIASCLSSLDELITAQTEKIKVLKEHKKGLMQGLFPSEL